MQNHERCTLCSVPASSSFGSTWHGNQWGRDSLHLLGVIGKSKVDQFGLVVIRKGEGESATISGVDSWSPRGLTLQPVAENIWPWSHRNQQEPNAMRKAIMDTGSSFGFCRAAGSGRSTERYLNETPQTSKQVCH